MKFQNVDINTTNSIRRILFIQFIIQKIYSNDNVQLSPGKKRMLEFLKNKK